MGQPEQGEEEVTLEDIEDEMYTLEDRLELIIALLIIMIVLLSLIVYWLYKLYSPIR